MYGDIIYVERQPLLWRSAEYRRNPKSKILDIAIYRTTKYSHYGIDLGSGKVIHFLGYSIWERQDSVITITSMEEFAKDGEVKVLRNIPNKFSHEEIVERAMSTLSTNFGGYSILENNCEHFAIWCATGSRASMQSGKIKTGISVVSNPIAPISKKVLAFASAGVSYSKNFLRR